MTGPTNWPPYHPYWRFYAGWTRFHVKFRWLLNIAFITTVATNNDVIVYDVITSFYVINVICFQLRHSKLNCDDVTMMKVVKSEID